MDVTNLETELEKKKAELEKLQRQIRKVEHGRRSQRKSRSTSQTAGQKVSKLHGSAGLASAADSAGQNIPGTPHSLHEHTSDSLMVSGSASWRESPSTSQREIPSSATRGIPLRVGEQSNTVPSLQVDKSKESSHSRRKQECAVISQAGNLVRCSQDPHSPIWIEGMEYPAQYLVRQTRSMSAKLSDDGESPNRLFVKKEESPVCWKLKGNPGEPSRAGHCTALIPLIVSIPIAQRSPIMVEIRQKEKVMHPEAITALPLLKPCIPTGFNQNFFLPDEGFQSLKLQKLQTLQEAKKQKPEGEEFAQRSPIMVEIMQKEEVMHPEAITTLPLFKPCIPTGFNQNFFLPDEGFQSLKLQKLQTLQEAKKQKPEGEEFVRAQACYTLRCGHLTRGQLIHSDQQGPGILLHSHQQAPGRPLQSDQPGPGSPLQSDQQGPGSPLRSDQQGPGSPLQSDQQGPGSPLQSDQQSDQQAPGSPLQSDQGPGSHLQFDQGPGSPLQSDQAPDNPLQFDQGPGSPLQSDQGPDSPLQSDQGPDSPLQSDQGPDSPLQTANQEPSGFASLTCTRVYQNGQTSEMQHCASLHCDTEKPLCGSLLVAMGDGDKWLHVAAVFPSHVFVYSITANEEWKRNQWILGQGEAVQKSSMLCYGNYVLLFLGGDFHNSNARLYAVGGNGDSVATEFDLGYLDRDHHVLCMAVCSWVTSTGVTLTIAQQSSDTASVDVKRVTNNDGSWSLTGSSSLHLVAGIMSISSLNHVENSHDWVIGIGDLSLLLWDASEGVLLRRVSLSCNGDASLNTQPVGLMARQEQGLIFLLLGYEETSGGVCREHTSKYWLLAFTNSATGSERCVCSCHCRLLRTYTYPSKMIHSDVRAMSSVDTEELVSLVSPPTTAALWRLSSAGSAPISEFTIRGGGAEFRIASLHWLGNREELLLLDQDGTIHIFKTII